MQNHRNFVITVVGMVVGAVLLLVSISAVYNPDLVMKIKTGQTFGTDSGVKACKTMVDNMAKNKTSSSNTKLSETRYHQIRKPFEQSRHADVRVAGTNLVDTIYKVDKTPESDQNLGNAIILMGTVQAQWGQLQTACGNHGVTVPALPMK